MIMMPPMPTLKLKLFEKCTQDSTLHMAFMLDLFFQESIILYPFYISNLRLKLAV
jgi:hypothetical protein